MNKEIIIYSCNLGGYDKVKDPLFIDSNASYILFTDNPNLKYKHWIPILINYKDFSIDPQRAARYIKLNPHLFLPKNHKINIWVDSCYRVEVPNLILFVNKNLDKNDLSVYLHPKRDCIYDEIDICSGLKLDYSHLFEKQKQAYLKENFPKHYGLYHTAVLIRKNNERIKELNELWWQELNTYSKRDQISFSYCLWKLGLKPNVIDKTFGETLYKSKQFKKFKHMKGRKLYV